VASTDDVFSLLKAVNEVTLKRMENKADAINAVTLKRMEDQIKQMDDYVHTLGQQTMLIANKLGVVPSSAWTTPPGTTPTGTTPTGTSTTDPHLGGVPSM
jgi:hypothetical protein